MRDGTERGAAVRNGFESSERGGELLESAGENSERRRGVRLRCLSLVSDGGGDGGGGGREMAMKM